MRRGTSWRPRGCLLCGCLGPTPSVEVGQWRPTLAARVSRSRRRDWGARAAFRSVASLWRLAQRADILGGCAPQFESSSQWSEPSQATSARSDPASGSRAFRPPAFAWRAAPCAAHTHGAELQDPGQDQHRSQSRIKGDPHVSVNRGRGLLWVFSARLRLVDLVTEGVSVSGVRPET